MNDVVGMIRQHLQPKRHRQFKWAPMSIEAMLLIALGVFFIAFTFAPVGMGGGMLFVPLLHYGADWAIDGRTIAVSLTLTCIVSYGSGLAHRREGYVEDSLVKTGLYGAIPGALIGVLIVTIIGSHLDSVFKVLSLCMITWAIWKTVSNNKSKTTTEPSADTEIQTIPLQIGAGIGGMLSSVLAVGAGVIYVPIMQTFAHLKPRIAIGSSLHLMMVVIPVAILAHLIIQPAHAIEQLIGDLPFIAILGVLTFAGARSGAHFGIKYLSEERIMMVFLALIIVVAIRYLIDLIGL